MLKTLKQIFDMESIPCMYLLDFLKRLLPKLCLKASLMCFLNLLHFESLLIIYEIEQNVVAYSHAYI